MKTKTKPKKTIRFRMPKQRNGIPAGWNIVKAIMVIRENGSYADFLRAANGQ